jgi:hypothetical protein
MIKMMVFCANRLLLIGFMIQVIKNMLKPHPPKFIK